MSTSHTPFSLYGGQAVFKPIGGGGFGTIGGGGGGGGEVNTASSAGGDVSLVLPKVGADLPFRGITAGSKISLIQRANDIEISAIGDGGAERYIDLLDVNVSNPPQPGQMTHFNAVSGKFEQTAEMKVDPTTRDINQVTTGAIGIVADGNVGIQSINGDSVVAAGGEARLLSSGADANVVSLGGNVGIQASSNINIQTSTGVLNLNAGVVDVAATGVVDITSDGAVSVFATGANTLSADGDASLISNNATAKVNAVNGNIVLMSNTSSSWDCSNELRLQGNTNLVGVAQGGDVLLRADAPTGNIYNIVGGNVTSQTTNTQILTYTGYTANITDNRCLTNKEYVDTVAGGADKVTKTGDSGSALSIGTLDAFPIALKTSGVDRLIFSETGATQLLGFGGTTIAETNAGSNLNISSTKGTTLTSNRNALQVPSGASSIIVTNGINAVCAPTDATSVRGGTTLNLGVQNADGVINFEIGADPTSKLIINKAPDLYSASIALDENAVPNVRFVNDAVATAGGIQNTLTNPALDFGSAASVNLETTGAATQAKLEASGAGGIVSLVAAGEINIERSGFGILSANATDTTLSAFGGDVVLNPTFPSGIAKHTGSASGYASLITGVPEAIANVEYVNTAIATAPPQSINLNLFTEATMISALTPSSTGVINKQTGGSKVLTTSASAFPSGTILTIRNTGEASGSILRVEPIQPGIPEEDPESQIFGVALQDSPSADSIIEVAISGIVSVMASAAHTCTRGAMLTVTTVGKARITVAGVGSNEASVGTCLSTGAVAINAPILCSLTPSFSHF